jgi:hypothetical protein
MATAASLLIAMIGLWLLYCIVISVFGRRTSQVYASTAVYLGGAALLTTGIFGWSIDITRPPLVPGGAGCASKQMS